MFASKLEQQKAQMQQLEDGLASIESWGELASPLEKAVEILHALLHLSPSFPALKVSYKTLYRNGKRIFKHVIWTIDNIAQLYASGDENAACEKSQSLRRGLVKLLPELEDTNTLCSLTGLDDTQPDSSNVRHITYHLRAITNIINSINELLVFFKSIFCAFNRSSLFLWGFSETSSRLEKIISKLEATTVAAQASGYRFLSLLFRTLDRPFKIAINALRLLFIFPTFQHIEFDVVIALCENAVQIFVCATTILNDLTHFFLKRFSNFEEVTDKLSQRIQAVHKCCSEMFAQKANNVIVPLTLCNTKETAVNIAHKFPYYVPVSQNVGDIETKGVSTSQESSKSIPMPQSLHDTKASSVDTSQESSKNVSMPHSLHDTKARGVDTSQESSKNVSMPHSLHDTKASGVDTSQESSKNVSMPQSLHDTKASGVVFSQELPMNALCGHIPQNLLEMKASGAGPSQESSTNTSHCQAPLSVRNFDVNCVDTLQESTRNAYNVPIPRSLCCSKTSGGASHELSKTMCYGPALSSISKSKTDSFNKLMDTNGVGSSVNTQNAPASMNLFHDSSVILEEIPAAVAFFKRSDEANSNVEMEIPMVLKTIPVPDLCRATSPCPGISDDKFKSLTLDERQLLEDLVAKSKYHMNFLSFSLKSTKLEVEVLCKICNKTIRLESIEEHVNELSHTRNLFDKYRTNSKVEINSILNTPCTTSMFVDICDIKFDSIVPNQKQILQKLITKLTWHVNHFLFAVKPVDTENLGSEVEILEPQAVNSETQAADLDFLVSCKICNKTLLAEHIEVHIQDPSHHRNIYEKCKASSEAQAAVPEIKTDNWRFLKIASDTQYKCSLCKVSFGSGINGWVLHFHSFVHRAKFKEWKLQTEEIKDLFASAHFFRDSLETTFPSLENSQKDRVNTLFDKLKDAMNFFSIEKKPDSAKLSFFCHVCRESVVSRKVPDHVEHKDHLRRLAHDGRRMLKKSKEQSNHLCESDAEYEKSCLLNVSNAYSNDSYLTASDQNSAQTVRKRSRSSVNHTVKIRNVSCERVQELDEQSLSSQEEVTSPCPKIRNIKGRQSSSPLKQYFKNIYIEVPDCSNKRNVIPTDYHCESCDGKIPVRADRHEATNLQGLSSIRAKVAPYSKLKVRSTCSVQTVTAAPEVSDSCMQNTAEQLVANLKRLSSICYTNFAPYMKSKVSPAFIVEEVAPAPEISNSLKQNGMQNTENTAENLASKLQHTSNICNKDIAPYMKSKVTSSFSEKEVAVAPKISNSYEQNEVPNTENTAEKDVSNLQGSYGPCTKVALSARRCDKNNKCFQKKHCTECFKKMPKSCIPNPIQNPEQNSAKNFLNLRSSGNVRAKVISYLKSRGSSQSSVRNIIPVREASNSSEENIAQNVAHYTEQNVAQKLLQNTVKNFASNSQGCCSTRAKVAFSLKSKMSVQPTFRNNTAVAEVLNFPEQDVAENTERNFKHLRKTAKNFASNSLPVLLPEAINLEQDSFNRIFNSLSPQDKQTVRDIMWQIKDKMNDFALSNKPGTNELRMVCKLCRCPMRPEKVVGHISELLHLKRLAEQNIDFYEVLQ